MKMSKAAASVAFLALLLVEANSGKFGSKKYKSIALMQYCCAFCNSRMRREGAFGGPGFESGGLGGDV